MESQFRVTGIVVGAIDYKENDKLITIYTLQLGKISATVKGVKNKNAKLKFASQLFCVADFVLNKTGEYFTVISADQIESFYDITSDYDKFLAGQALLEITNIIMLPKIINENYFIQMLKYLQSLSYEQVSHKALLVKFLLYVFENNGYGLNFTHCAVCNTPFMTDVYFSHDEGFLTCKNCATLNSDYLSPKTFSSLKLLNNCELSKLSTVKIDDATILSVLQILAKNFQFRFNKCIKIITNYII